MSNQNNDSRYSFYFYGFVAAHVLIWTLLPTFLRYNLPLDAIEAVSWGHNLQLGYLKHPPLSGWMAEMMLKLFSGQMWAMYLLAQICVAISFIATWELAKDFLTRQKSLMSLLLLEAIFYYNFTSIEFNANIALMPLWSLVTLFAWKVVKNPQSFFFWVALALCSVLAFYAKYYSMVLFGGIFLLFLSEKELRHIFKTLNPYLFGLIFFALILPHIFWLFDNDFSTFAYAKTRAYPVKYHWYNHLIFPVLFLLAQLGILLLPLLIFFSAKRGLGHEKNHQNIKAKFLIFVGMVPLILAILPSVISGGRMRDMWGSVMWSWFGIALFYFYQPRISAAFSKRFYLGIAFVLILTPAVFIADNLLNHNKYGNFDGKLLVQEIRKIHPDPIPVAVGDIWLTGNMNFFDNPRPLVLFDLEKRNVAEETLAILERDGGIILWNARLDGDILPEKFRRKIVAGIEVQQPINLPYIKFVDAPLYRVGWAIVMPAR